MVKTLIKSFLIILFCFSCRLSQAVEETIVRVAVFQNVSKISLDINTAFEFKSIDGSQVLFSSPKARGLVIKPMQGGFLTGEDKINVERLVINRLDDGFISVNGRLFRGHIRLINTGALTFSVVNFVESEDYIRGVLYHEISHLWPFETIKAQAVVARTFALKEAKLNKNKDFDLTNDVYSQVYGGRTSERWRTNKAVEATKGEVLIFKDELLSAFYHATCAGHTEDANLVWGIDAAPLKGVVCTFCQYSPHFRWDVALPLKQVEDKLKKAGFKVSGIKGINILGRSISNRILKLSISSSSGDLELSGKQLREILGANILRSTNFEVRLKGATVFFDGFGWGHGVGLCQWGAYFMGKRGFTYRQIIEYYYPGVKLEKQY
jgi:stage II sporulation protein D